MEIWKPILKYPGYEVSNMGRVKSYKVYSSGKILSGKKSKGYLAIDFRIDGRTVQEFVHRIVLSTFNPIDNWENLTVNHKNGNRLDNRLENLEWMTLSENSYHARHVLKTGYSTKKVHIITLKKENLFFDTVTEAAKKIGVSKGTISRWANGTRSYEGKFRLVEYL